MDSATPTSCRSDETVGYLLAADGITLSEPDDANGSAWDRHALTTLVASVAP